jgi:hypothetical protein
VDLLNANEINVDSTPLDSFGDDYADDDDVDEDNKLEEIYEDSFELSQSSRKKRTGNYTEIEDTFLVQAWFAVW